MESIEVTVWRRKFALKMFQFLKCENLALRKLRTEQFRPVLVASLAVHTYALKNGGIRELFLRVFCKQNSPVSLPNSSRFLQLVLDYRQAKTWMPYKISVPTAFETELYFHALVLMSTEATWKRAKVDRNPGEQ